MVVVVVFFVGMIVFEGLRDMKEKTLSLYHSIISYKAVSKANDKEQLFPPMSFSNWLRLTVFSVLLLVTNLFQLAVKSRYLYSFFYSFEIVFYVVMRHVVLLQKCCVTTKGIHFRETSSMYWCRKKFPFPHSLHQNLQMLQPDFFNCYLYNRLSPKD